MAGTDDMCPLRGSLSNIEGYRDKLMMARWLCLYSGVFLACKDVYMSQTRHTLKPLYE